MSHLGIIEVTKDDLIQELDTLLGHFNLNEIADLAETLEQFLILNLNDSLKKYSEEFLGLKSDGSNDYLVSEESNILFSINICRDISNTKFLNVVINHHIIGEKTKVKNFHIMIDGYGNIQKVRLLFPESMNFDLVAINALIKNIYEVGYNWYKVKIEELVTQEKITLITELYGYIKKVIPSKDLRKHLWFASVTDEFGFRLLDKDVAMDLFERIDPNSEYYGHSTNRLVAEMLSTRLPKNNLLMQKAIEENKIMDVDIRDAKYSQEGNIYSAAMTAFYGCDSFTIHPIMADGKANIVALYPSNKRNEFEFLLNKHLDTLTKICKNSTSKIYQVQKLFEGKKTNVGKWGEFVGGFVKAFTDV